MRIARCVMTAAVVCMASGVIGLHGALAAQAIARASYDGVCQVGSLAAPGDPGYGPFSADYYSAQFSYGLSKHIHVVFAAYAPLNDLPPVVVSYQILKRDYTPLLGQPYSVKATGCQQNQTGSQPTTSMFTYGADWSTPSDPTRQGMYYLAISFRYTDGTLVEYFANISVRNPPETITAGAVHWKTTLYGIGYQQASAAYDLFSPGASNTVSAQTGFYFDANPAAVCAQTRCRPGSDSTTFIQGGMDNNLEGGNVFLLDTPPHVPFYRDGWGRQTSRFTFAQTLGGLSLTDTGTVFVERGVYPLGRHVYRYHVEVDEPFVLRSGTTTFVHVGSYVLDNGLTGPAGWQGAADNLGEGQGLRFYANPSTPEPPATVITTSALSADVTLSRYEVSPDAVEPPNGGTMAWQYDLHLYRANCPSTTKLSACTIGAEVAGSPHRTTATTDTWTGLPASTAGTGACYWAQARVVYTIKSQLHLSGPLIPAGYNPGDYNNVFCITQVAAPTDTPVPPTATATPVLAPTETPMSVLATDTSTPAPTDTTMPTPTNTPTSVPPTNTPSPLPSDTETPVPPTATPTPARGTATLAQTVVPYAWVRSYHGEDAAAQDRLYASSWGHNPDPATFYWPIGRPLHLLPAVDENPAEDRLTIDDLGNGATAVLYPSSVTATNYTLLDAGALGSARCLPASPDAQPHAYRHDARYPSEIDPFSSRVAVVWAPAGLAGTLPATTVRCDPAPLLQADMGGPVTLSYRVSERLVFTARFANPAPRVGGASDCASRLVPGPAAMPFSAEPGVPAPAPALAPAPTLAGPCSAGSVGLAAARQTLDHWRTEVVLAAPNGIISGVSYVAAGTLLRIVVTVERTVALHYHLLVSREVLP